MWNAASVSLWLHFWANSCPSDVVSPPRLIGPRRPASALRLEVFSSQG